MVAMLDFQAARWTVAGEVGGQEGNHHPTSIPRGCFPTADGHVNIAGPSGRLWRRFCEVIGAPELLTDERYATGPLRSRNRAELNAAVEARLRTRTTADWVDALTAVGVPAGPVNTIDQVFADPQVQHLGLATPVHHPRLGELSIVRNAVALTGLDGDGSAPGAGREPTVRTASPDPGQHTDEVLAEAGLAPAEIADLRTRGVIA
jgi:formyl-CoA transferase